VQCRTTRGRLSGWAVAVPVAVFAVAAALVRYKVLADIAGGPGWDTYAFLSNAAEFAGRGYGYTELHRPPFLSLLTAGLFAAGVPMRESVIQWVDGAVSLTGLVAFYLIARRRFSRPLAGIGALMLLCVQPLWQYLGSGYTDMPSVSLSLWLLWSLIKAAEDDPRWYLLSGPLFTASVMTRYTAILAAFPIAIWVTLRWKPFHQAKYIGGGIALAAAAYVPAAIFYGARFGDILFPFLMAFGMSENISAPTGEGSASVTASWYVRMMPEFLGGEPVILASYAVLLVAALGLVLALGTYLQTHRPRLWRLVSGVLWCMPAVLAQLGGGMVLRQVTIPIAVGGLWRALAPYEDTPTGRRVTGDAALVATMVAWVLTYFDFHGHQPIQVPRYVITVAAPLVFLLMLGWQAFVSDIRRTLVGDHVEASPAQPGPLVRYAAPVLLAGFVLASVATTMAATAVEPPDPYVIAAKETSAWLREQPDIDDAMVMSELWPITAWYTRVPVKAMAAFPEKEAYQHALDKHEADYYVAIHGGEYAGYRLAMETADAHVLERRAGAAARLPRVGYLGKAWDNYLESVTGYTFYLTGDQGPQEWGEMMFSDAMTARELAEYRAIAVFGVRWKDRATGESALREYVEAGGSVVIDASGNLGTMPYDLADTVVFDTVIRRRGLPADASIVLDDEFAARHPSVGRVVPSAFTDESGGPWYGADYTPLPGSPPLEVLATVDGRPAVVSRQVGAGRVYFIGYNLAWHAFITGNESERRLIEAVFADALGAPESGDTW